MSVELEQIAAKAVQIKPLRAVLWLLVAPFVVLLFLLRFVWLVPAFAIGASIEGWNAADKLIKQWQAQAREARRG